MCTLTAVPVFVGGVLVVQILAWPDWWLEQTFTFSATSELVALVGLLGCILLGFRLAALVLRIMAPAALHTTDFVTGVTWLAVLVWSLMNFGLLQPNSLLGIYLPPILPCASLVFAANFGWRGMVALPNTGA